VGSVELAVWQARLGTTWGFVERGVYGLRSVLALGRYDFWDTTWPDWTGSIEKQPRNQKQIGNLVQRMVSRMRVIALRMLRIELVPKMFGVRFQGRRIRKHTLLTSEVKKRGEPGTRHASRRLANRPWGLR